MAKIRIAALGKKVARTAKYKVAVRAKHVRGSRGKRVKLFSIDSNDDNFGDRLTRVFSLNIASERQANTAMFGSPDGPVKSAAKVQKPGKSQSN